jgi:hypothetical protein
MIGEIPAVAKASAGGLERSRVPSSLGRDNLSKPLRKSASSDELVDQVFEELLAAARVRRGIALLQ